MKYLKLFEKFVEFDPFDPFGEESYYDNLELNFIYLENDGICFIRRKNNTLFRLVSANWHPRGDIRREKVYRFIDYGTAEYFRPKIPLNEKIIKRIINDKIEIRASKWAKERIPFSKLLRVSNLKLEDIIFLDEKNIKKYI